LHRHPLLVTHWHQVKLLSWINNATIEISNGWQNKPLTLSSQPNLVLNTKNIGRLLKKGVSEKFKKPAVALN
jgi:hypothetical protein